MYHIFVLHYSVYGQLVLLFPTYCEDEMMNMAEQVSL